MEIKVAQEFSVIVGYARDEAMRTGHYGITVDHLILGLLRHADNAACRALSGLGIDCAELKRHIDSAIFRDKGIPFCDEDRIGFTKGSHSTIQMAVLEALRHGALQAGSIHLLLAIARTSNNAGIEYLSARGADYNAINAWISRNGEQAPAPRKAAPSAEDIADAMEAEIRRLMASNQLQTEIYS